MPEQPAPAPGIADAFRETISLMARSGIPGETPSSLGWQREIVAFSPHYATVTGVNPEITNDFLAYVFGLSVTEEIRAFATEILGIGLKIKHFIELVVVDLDGTLKWELHVRYEDFREESGIDFGDDVRYREMGPAAHGYGRVDPGLYNLTILPIRGNWGIYESEIGLLAVQYSSQRAMYVSVPDQHSVFAEFEMASLRDVPAEISMVRNCIFVRKIRNHKWGPNLMPQPQSRSALGATIFTLSFPAPRLCHTCGRDVSNAHLTGDELMSNIFCPNCTSPPVNYWHCETCGGQHYFDLLQDRVCPESPIARYDWRPRPHFFGLPSRGAPFYGVEIEVENQKPTIPTEFAAYAITRASNGVLYAKHDGSLRDGFEFVSHPMTYDFYRSNKDVFNMVSNLRYYGFRSYAGGRCGIHVHVSKNTFNSLHLYKFLRFVYENPYYILALSQRSMDTMARWAILDNADHSPMIAQRAKEKNNCGLDKYEAVNLMNENTVELRVFRGSLNPITMHKCIQLTDALVWYTRDASVADLSPDGLEAHIKRNSKYYPELIEWLRLRGGQVAQINTRTAQLLEGTQA